VRVTSPAVHGSVTATPLASSSHTSPQSDTVSGLRVQPV
jgi:hypothetical protein